MLISVASLYSSNFLIMTLFLPHLAHLLLMRSLKLLNAFFEIDTFNSMFITDFNGIIFTFGFCYSGLFFWLLIIDKWSLIDANNQSRSAFDSHHIYQLYALIEMTQHRVCCPSTWHQLVRHPQWGWLYPYQSYMHIVSLHYPQENLMFHWTPSQYDNVHPYMATVGPVDRWCES